MKKITCKNDANIQVDFTYDFKPFFLVSVEGVYKVTNNVNTTENTMIDGATYQGSTTSMRNIVITAQMEKDYQKNRNILYKCFKPKSYGTLTYIENEEIRMIQYIVEDIEISETGVLRDITISLICPDPFFRGLENIYVEMARWEKQFEFPHEFVEELEEIETRNSEKIKQLDNESNADNVGMTITIEADGPVQNPVIHHVEQKEYIKLETTMQAGEKIVITTETNNKAIWIEKEGEKEENNGIMSEESEFLQLQSGLNTIQYEAESGEEYLNISIEYRYRYLGV